MNRHSCTAIFLLVISLALPAPAVLAQESEPTLDKIARTGEFVIGYRADSSPLSYENSLGEPSGYSVDLCRRIAAAICSSARARARSRFCSRASSSAAVRLIG